MHHPHPRVFWAWTLTITSALLAVVWVGSMRVFLRVHVTPAYFVHVAGGCVDVARFKIGVPIGASASPFVSGAQRVEPWDTQQWQAWWLYHHAEVSIYSGETRTDWLIPLWPFVLLTGVPGVWMLVKTRRRPNPNACPACGYDRTGLPQDAPCPECGKGRGRTGEQVNR